MQAAILHSDGLAMSSAHGLADVEISTPLTTGHLFRIASHSKTFTATAIMQLVEQGTVRLDDTAGHWLPFLGGSQLDAVTIRELLGHGAGVVRDGWDGDFWQLARPFPDAAELRRVSIDNAAVLHRNERFKYSNIGFALLGQVIETATGHSYGAYVTENIVRRLGLQDTGPELDRGRVGEYATGYSSLSYADRRIPIEHVDTGALASATGFYSTASDVVRYLSAHFHGDSRLLSDDSKRVMQRTEWEVDGTETAYGLGLAIVEVGGRRMLGHGGGYPGHITRSLFDPVAGLAVSVLTNAIDGPAQMMAAAAIRLIDLAQRGLSAADSQPRPDHGIDISAFRGRFASLWGVFDIVDLGGRLYLLDPNAEDPTVAPQRLEPVDVRTLRIAEAPGYASPGERLEFERTADGTACSVRGGSGTTAYPIDDLSGAVATRDRITLGAPLRPVDNDEHSRDPSRG